MKNGKVKLTLFRSEYPHFIIFMSDSAQIQHLHYISQTSMWSNLNFYDTERISNKLHSCKLNAGRRLSYKLAVSVNFQVSHSVFLLSVKVFAVQWIFRCLILRNPVTLIHKIFQITLKFKQHFNNFMFQNHPT